MNGKPQVLVVEDEFSIGASLSDALREASLDSVHATDAEQALGILSRGSIRLVITDLKMAGSIDGLALVKWLSKVRPSLPVIVTSGYHAHRTEVGAVPFFEKPYRLGAVVERAKQMLG